MKNRPWNVKHPQKNKVRALADAIGAPSLLAGVLVSRGVEDAQTASQLLMEAPPMSDPYLMKDMDKAVERIRRALDEGETIVVFGDYDVDGITATALLYNHLKNLGGSVKCKLPTRQGDGYGLNKAALDSLKAKGITLVVTVDNGISAVEEAEYARELGIDLIITDHHLPPEPLPNAYAVVDPMRSDDATPFKGLCGAGVAFKLCAALEECAPEELLDYCGDLAAIGTVADVMPLTGENRTLVRAGLEVLQHTDRPGLNALMTVAGINGKPIGADTISFSMAPRINAAGRMEDPTLALRLMLCEDDDRALELAYQLDELNNARRQVAQDIMTQIERQLAEYPDRLSDRVLMVWGEDFHPGIIGIVASRLVEQYSRPAVVIALKDGEGRGSGRSIPGFSLHDALGACSDLLIRYGGHALAAGLSVEPDKIELLRRALNDWALDHYPVAEPPARELDLSVKMSQITVEQIEGLQYLAPYGNGNPSPEFLVENVTIEGIWAVSEGRHSRLRLRQGSALFYAVYFGIGPQALPYSTGDTVDICAVFSVFNAKSGPEVSTQIQAIRPAGMKNIHCGQEALMDAFLAGVPLNRSQREVLTPSRADTVAVYRQLQGGKVMTGDLRPLFAQLGEENTGKILVSLEALRQVGLIQAVIQEDGRSLWQAVPTKGKKDLWSAPVLQALAPPSREV